MTFQDESRLQHALHAHFPSLSQFHSTQALKRSRIFLQIEQEVHRLLTSHELENSAAPASEELYYRAVAWNVERGMHFEGVLHYLKNHPVLGRAGLLLLTEVDLGMARSGNRHVARELARALGMSYFFAPSYLNLAKGAGTENDFDGENEFGIHGNAILSRYPIRDPQIVPLPNGIDKMRGREKRLGQQQALLATIDVAGKPLRVACAHLDQRSSQDHRRLQMEKILSALSKDQGLPVLIGGDWNTSTYATQNALTAIAGFWRRVSMGVGHVMRNHYPYPERYFEKKFFRMLEEHGFDYKECNELGGCTNHYWVEDIKQSKNLGEWVPEFWFRFLEWSLRPYGGKCSLKLDWFAQRGLHILGRDEKESSRKGRSMAPQVVGDLIYEGLRVSDHDAILVDFTLPGNTL